MSSRENDSDRLGLILRYCERLSRAKAHFGSSFDQFEKNEIYQDSASMCLVQIGEAVNHLSEEFRADHPEIEWSRIYGMRCHLVHGYEMFDADIVWDAMENYLPSLQAFCEERCQP